MVHPRTNRPLCDERDWHWVFICDHKKSFHADPVAIRAAGFRMTPEGSRSKVSGRHAVRFAGALPRKGSTTSF